MFSDQTAISKHGKLPTMAPYEFWISKNENLAKGDPLKYPTKHNQKAMAELKFIPNVEIRAYFQK